MNFRIQERYLEKGILFHEGRGQGAWRCHISQTEPRHILEYLATSTHLHWQHAVRTGEHAVPLAAHAHGAIVQLHQKGAPNSKAHLKEAVLIGTKATLINNTITLNSTSGIAEENHIKIDNEIFKVVAIDSENNEVSIYSAQQGTTASNHSKNAKVTQLDGTMQPSSTTFTLQQNFGDLIIA